MLENVLWTLIISTIQTGLTANGFTDVKIKQMFQPMQDGTNTQPTVYLHRISDHRYGSPRRADVFDADNDVFIHTETEFYESVFQATILSLVNPQNAASVAAPTALDIANIVAAILQTESTLKLLAAQGVRIYRITDIRKPNFIDDKGRFEASPNFDFTITHQQDIISEVPLISEIDPGIYPI